MSTYMPGPTTSTVEIDRRPAGELAAFGAHKVRSLARGEFLFRAGEGARSLYFIETGHVSLTITTEGGDEIETEIRGPGHFLGSEALFGLPHDVTAQAVTPCRVLSFAAPGRRPGRVASETSGPIVRDLLEDIHDLRLRLLNMATRSAIQRLAVYLLEKRTSDPSGPIVPLPWGSKTRLARYLAIRQETLSRLLVELATRGAIELYDRGVRILKPELLEEIVQ
jgi:CRP/FNR family transcriptional regulator